MILKEKIDAARLLRRSKRKPLNLLRTSILAALVCAAPLNLTLNEFTPRMSHDWDKLTEIAESERHISKAICWFGFFGLPPSYGIFGGAAAVVGYATSIEQVSITIANGATSNTATLSTPVTLNKSYIVWQGQSGSSASFNPAITRARIELTNTNTVTATRNTSDTGTLTVNAVIVATTTNLAQSCEHGTVAISASTSGTSTLANSVTTTRSVAFWLGSSTTSTTTSARNWGTAVDLTNTNTVTGHVNTSGTHTVGYCVVQWAAAVLQSNVQQYFDAYATDSGLSKTISSVDPNNTFIAYGGETTDSIAGDMFTWAARDVLSNATTVQFSGPIGLTVVNITPYYAIVEFKAGTLASNVQRGAISITNPSTSNTATISSVTTARTFASCAGISSGSTGTGGTSRDCARMTLTNATTVTGTRGGTGIMTSAGIQDEVIEFNQ